MKTWEKSSWEEGTVKTELLVTERQGKRPVWSEHVGGECSNECGKCKIMEVFADPGKT